MNELSLFDVEAIRLIRKSVDGFLANAASKYEIDGGVLLDVAPQDHKGASPFFTRTAIQTLDIDPQSGATHVADLCRCSGTVGLEVFDYIVCTEVLEHTLQPFDAVSEMFAMLKPGGYVFVSTPFNFRIHGPLPDCWRFTEHGLRSLFRQFEIVELLELVTPDRWLMPIQYTLVARRPLA